MLAAHSRRLIAAPLVAVALALCACGGVSSDPKPPQTGVSTPDPAITATPDASFASLPASIAFNPSTPDVLGNPNPAAAARLRGVLNAGSIVLAEDAIHVMPIKGTQQALLLLVLDEANAASAFSDPKFLSRVSAAAAADPARISHVTLDISARDSKGPFVLTMTAPLGAFSSFAAGSKAPEVTRQLVYSLKYEAAP